MLVDNETNGAWGRASEVVLPRTRPRTAGAALRLRRRGVSIAGDCASGGQYQDRVKYQGFLVNEVSGHWQASTEWRCPPGGPGGQERWRGRPFVHLSGQMHRRSRLPGFVGNYQALLINETNNAWSAGTRITLPSGPRRWVRRRRLRRDCQKTGVCDAVGSYETRQGTISVSPTTLPEKQVPSNLPRERISTAKGFM